MDVFNGEAPATILTHSGHKNLTIRCINRGQVSHKKVHKTLCSGWSALSRDREDTLFVVTGAGVWEEAENTETDIEIPQVSTPHLPHPQPSAANGADIIIVIITGYWKIRAANWGLNEDFVPPRPE